MTTGDVSKQRTACAEQSRPPTELAVTIVTIVLARGKEAPPVQCVLSPSGYIPRLEMEVDASHHMYNI